MATYSVADFIVPIEARGFIEAKDLSQFDTAAPGQTIPAGTVFFATPDSNIGTLTGDVIVKLENSVSRAKKQITLRAGYPVRRAITFTILPKDADLIERTVDRAVGLI
jgi:hypothetical protein